MVLSKVPGYHVKGMGARGALLDGIEFSIPDTGDTPVARSAIDRDTTLAAGMRLARAMPMLPKSGGHTSVVHGCLNSFRQTHFIRHH